MSVVVNRPKAVFRPGDGLLRNEHFQIAWVTTDMERAAKIFSDRYGVKNMHSFDATMASGGQLKVKLAWVGGYMMELIEAHGPGTEFYTEKFPAEGFCMQMHHLGYLVGDEPGWNSLMEEIDRGGWTIRSRNHTEGRLRHVYVEMPELGHYLEYMLLEPAFVSFFENLPSN